MMALSQQYREILQSMEGDIRMTVQLPSLLKFLSKKDLVSQSEYRLLSDSGIPEEEKHQKLMTIIPTKGKNAYHLFIKALEEETEHLGHKSLAAELRDLDPKPKPSPRLPRRSIHELKPASPVLRPDAGPQDVSRLLVLVKQLTQKVEGIDARVSHLEQNKKSFEQSTEQHISSLQTQLNFAMDNFTNQIDGLRSSIAEQEPTDKDDSYSLPSMPVETTTSFENDYVERETPFYAPVTVEKTSPGSSASTSTYTTLLPDREISAVEYAVLTENRYDESRLLASGKNGELWLAVHKTTGAQSVIKKPNQEVDSSQEIVALKELNPHPNIVPLIGVQYTRLHSMPSLIFKYFENGHLFKYLQSNDVKVPQLLNMASGVACGMMKLEQNGIIHCNLRARSVLIDSQHNCRIGSFSKARCLKHGESSYIPPTEVNVKGAIRWLAPEIFRRREFSIRSDMWAFGVFLSEVFSSGAYPYPDMTTNDEVKENVINGVTMSQPAGCPNVVFELMKSIFQYHARDRPTFATVHRRLRDLCCRENSGSGSESEEAVTSAKITNPK